MEVCAHSRQLGGLASAGHPSVGGGYQQVGILCALEEIADEPPPEPGARVALFTPTTVASLARFSVALRGSAGLLEAETQPEGGAGSLVDG